MTTNDVSISKLATTKAYFLFTRSLYYGTMQFSRADNNCPPGGNSIYIWEVKARENRDVLDM